MLPLCGMFSAILFHPQENNNFPDLKKSGSLQQKINKNPSAHQRWNSFAKVAIVGNEVGGGCSFPVEWHAQ